MQRFKQIAVTGLMSAKQSAKSHKKMPKGAMKFSAISLVTILLGCGGSSGSNEVPTETVQQQPCGELKSGEQCFTLNNRNFLLLSPSVKQPQPGIMLAFYGSPPSYGTPRKLESFLALQQYANDNNMLIAMPIGGPDWAWDSEVTAFGQSKDTALSLAIIDKLVAEYQANNTKVAALGFSAGAMMAYQLACSVPNRVKAVFAISGQLRGDLTACNPTLPVVVHHLHGSKDTDMPIDGRTTVSGNVINSLDGTIARFRRINGCAENAIDSEPFALTANQTAVSKAYQGCLKATGFTLLKDGIHHPDYQKAELHRLMKQTLNLAF
jgi:poly(3-hydroxybutyrate) depolymerase